MLGGLKPTSNGLSLNCKLPTVLKPHIVVGLGLPLLLKAYFQLRVAALAEH